MQNAPVLNAPVQTSPVLNAPVQNAPVLNAPVQNAPVLNAPVQTSPVLNAPVQNAPVLNAPVQNAPVQNAMVQNATFQMQNATVQNATTGVVMFQRQDSAHAYMGSLTTPPRTTSPQQQNESPMCDLPFSPGSLLNYLNQGQNPSAELTDQRVVRKMHVKRLFTTQHIFGFWDIINMLVESKTHKFKCSKKQNLFDSYNFQKDSFDLMKFTLLLAAFTPEDLIDMNAICDYIGNNMIVDAT